MILDTRARVLLRRRRLLVGRTGSAQLVVSSATLAYNVHVGDESGRHVTAHVFR